MVLKLGEVVRSGTGVMLSTIELLEVRGVDYVTVCFFGVRISFLNLITYKVKAKTYNMYTMLFTSIYLD